MARYFIRIAVHFLINNYNSYCIPCDMVGGVPYDGATSEKLHPNDNTLIIIYSIVTFAGLVLTVVCLLFNMVFRNKK